MAVDKPVIPYPIAVEGKYDKIKLTSLFEARVFVTDGFGVFRREDKVAFFRKLTEKTPLIVLTDSDGAGTVIRNYFKLVTVFNTCKPSIYQYICNKQVKQSANYGCNFHSVNEKRYCNYTCIHNK